MDHITKIGTGNQRKRFLCFLFILKLFSSICLYVLADLDSGLIKYESDGVQKTQHVSVRSMWNFVVVLSDALLICFHSARFYFRLLHDLLEMDAGEST